MSDEMPPPSLQIPQAEIRTKRSISIIWVVPLAALLIGGWMGYKAWSEQGPTITISFASAEGLQKDKTKLKYMEVDIGKVVDIKLSDDLSRVLVKIELERNAEPYLTEDALFWVVRARVTADEISGLGTLFSGAYIGMEPGKSGKSRRQFTGLEVAPVLTGTLPGQHFTLHAEELGSIDIGYPVYYRKVKVGQVVSYQLDPLSDRLNIQVFIHAPFHKKVQQGTRFYNASGIDIAVNADGLKVTTESLVSLLIGGIAFETPTEPTPWLPADKTADYTLYPNQKSIHQRAYTIKERYLLHFKDSVQGLSIGAPVEIHGIQVGQVLDISLSVDAVTMDITIPVLIELEPERIAEKNATRAPDVPLIDFLVAHGLRGQLKNSNLLTGQQVVDLKIFSTATPQNILHNGPYPVVPTMPMTLPLMDLIAKAGRILTKFEQLPAAEISVSLKKVLATLDVTLQQSQSTLGHIDQNVLPEVVNAMQQFRTSVNSLEESYRSNSSTGRDIHKTLAEAAKAARSIRVLSDYLQRHPEALLRGKGETP